MNYDGGVAVRIGASGMPCYATTQRMDQLSKVDQHIFKIVVTITVLARL